MSRVVVTGGTGFVGANLVRRLIRDGHHPALLVRPGFSPWRIEKIQDQITIHEVDLGDPQAVIAALDSIRPTWIFHLAVYGAYSWQTDAEQMMQTNVPQSAQG